MYPRSNCMPSTTSSSLPRLFASSTVITPSLPTFCIASAIMRPISGSPLAEMVPTCAISSLEVTFLAFAFSSLTTAMTALSTPRLRSMGLPPAATDFAPSRTMAWARRVAVVVPSPAVSEVFEATSRTICAPMFSNLSSSSISFATVTPSLVIRGAPNDLSSTTLRPLGPRVTFTAFAKMSTPRNMRSRASLANLTSFAAIVATPLACRLGGFLLACSSAFKDAEDVAFLHDQELFAVDLDFGARPFAEEDAITSLNVERLNHSFFVSRSWSGSDHLALLGLFLRGIGNDAAAGSPLVLLDTTHHHPVVQWTKLHSEPPSKTWIPVDRKPRRSFPALI